MNPAAAPVAHIPRRLFACSPYESQLDAQSYSQTPLTDANRLCGLTNTRLQAGARAQLVREAVQTLVSCAFFTPDSSPVLMKIICSVSSIGAIREANVRR
jgi:hypothetical protein